MKIVAISDTHLNHPDMKDYWGDVIVHCGDVSNFGRVSEIESFINWFKELSYQYKIMIPGNHDHFFEEQWEEAKKMCNSAGIICLNDSNFEIQGVKFWGSPVSLRYGKDAFVREKGEDIQKHWDLIPENVDVLITHGPPANIGELSKVYKNIDKRNRSGEEKKRKICIEAGCSQLKEKVNQIKPKYHLFGHIHSGYGIYKGEHTTFINCAHLDVNHIALNPPVEFWI